MNKHERTEAMQEYMALDAQIKALKKRQDALKEALKAEFPSLEVNDYLDGFGCGADWSIVHKSVWDMAKVENYLKDQRQDITMYKKDQTAGTLRVRARA